MKRKLNKLVNEVNGVIHSRNLYMQTLNGNRRVIFAHVKDGEVVVSDLYNESQTFPVRGNKFADGYGQSVEFDQI